MIEQGELWGETEHQKVWADLAELLGRPFGDLVMRRAFIDSGFWPGKKDEVLEHRVYEFCRRHDVGNLHLLISYVATYIFCLLD